MTNENYSKELTYIKMDFERRKRELAIQYVTENAKFKVGDIVTDHIGSVKVEVVKTQLREQGYPETVYHGTELKKDLTPTKKGDKRSVWVSNIKEIIK